eukprot:6492168-Amphidinium_carterae.1
MQFAAIIDPSITCNRRTRSSMEPWITGRLFKTIKHTASRINASPHASRQLLVARTHGDAWRCFYMRSVTSRAQL